jgi:hypothetical protein
LPADAHHRIEIAQGILEHDGDGIAAHGAPIVLREMCHVAPGDAYPPGLDAGDLGGCQAQRRPCQRRLAGAGLPISPTAPPAPTTRLTPSRA